MFFPPIVHITENSLHKDKPGKNVFIKIGDQNKNQRHFFCDVDTKLRASNILSMTSDTLVMSETKMQERAQNLGKGTHTKKCQELWQLLKSIIIQSKGLSIAKVLLPIIFFSPVLSTRRDIFNLNLNRLVPLTG